MIVLKDHSFFETIVLRFLCRPSVLILAALLTLLNAIKPLQIDDAAYYCFARKIIEDPLHPYSGQVFWDQWPEPANDILAPLVLPYWWSLALLLFGDRPFLWKLWLFPFSLLFVAALDALLRRFARGLATPVLLMTVLSPTFLPSLNLMLDVPALALALSGLVLFLRACRRRSIGMAVLAGLVTGLAMQTKYTALLMPPAILLYVFTVPRLGLVRRLELGMASVLTAGLLFIGWECFMARQHGESHFLRNLRQKEPWLDDRAPKDYHGGTDSAPQRSWLDRAWERIKDKAHFAPQFLTIIGGVGPALLLLGLAGLATPPRWILAAGLLLLAGYAAVPFMESRQPEDSDALVPTTSLMFGHFGTVMVLMALVIAAWLCVPARRCRLSWRSSGFLLLWMLLEVAGAFALTDFSAVRRVMGMMIVGTLLTARLAAVTCRTAERRKLVWWVAGAGVALGLLYYGVDLRDGIAQQQAAEASARWIKERDPNARIWYVGHWSFQFYAERAGMVPLVPGSSRLEAGNWLVKPELRFNQQMMDVDTDRLELMTEETVVDALPLRTVSCFYGGYPPIERHQGPRIRVEIYRARSAFVPAPYRHN